MLNSPKSDNGTIEPQVQARIVAIVAEHRARPGATLPILHAIQDGLGYVPSAAVPLIAEGLNLSRAEIHGVLSFYSFFRTSPPGQHIIRLCRAEACQSMNAPALEAHAKQYLGVDFHQTTTDGRYTLEPVYCLGNCACAPAMMIDETLYGRVDAQRFDEIVADEAAR